MKIFTRPKKRMIQGPGVHHRSTPNFRVGKRPLNLKSEKTLNAPCTLCETLLARSEILYFLVFSQTELAPSPNKSCQYKVSATQYLPISSVVGTGYTIYCSFSYCPLMGTCTPKASLDLYWASKHPFFSLPENYVAKGQLISKGNFSLFNPTKKQTWKCYYLP